ncbi:MAG: phosphoribosylamine--glycine ligase [Candidatus Acidiferrales bacterium]
MKILVIGGGGREHALVWKLKQSVAVEKIWCAPGNGGISNDAQCVAIQVSDVEAICGFADREKPDLTVIGPELPLVLGLADELRRRGQSVLGPGKSAAQLEGSKVFAKEFMQRHGIPTARPYGVFESIADARAALASVRWPVVIKADGLCAGKGVLVAGSCEEAERFLERLMSGSEFGEAGQRVLLEEGLTGAELSYIVLIDGAKVIRFAPARDHKRAYDSDSGPNTGGMGAYSDDSLLPRDLEERIERDVVQPTIRGLATDNLDYRGFLYFGLMLTPHGPKVLEYNCRMGDPETQAILMRADFDLAEVLLAAAQRNLQETTLSWKPGASLCVVLAAAGYPEKPRTGDQIFGLGARLPDSEVAVFHAGTRRDSDAYYTTSGRVLGVCSRDRDLASARRHVYDVVSRIRIDGAHFRSDIGKAASEPGDILIATAKATE